MRVVVACAITARSRLSLMNKYKHRNFTLLNGSLFSVTRKISSERRQYDFSNLQEGVAYYVRLKEVSVSGVEGEFSTPLIGIPSTIGLRAGTWVGIAIGCIILFVITGVAVFCFFRFCCKRWREKEDIVMPNGTNILITKPAVSFIPPVHPNGFEGEEKGNRSLKMRSMNGCLNTIILDKEFGGLTFMDICDNNKTSLNQTNQFNPDIHALQEKVCGTESNCSQVTCKLTEDNSICESGGKSPEIQHVDDPLETSGYSNDGFVESYVTAGNCEVGPGTPENSGSTGYVLTCSTDSTDIATSSDFTSD